MAKELVIDGYEVRKAIKYYLQENYPEMYKLSSQEELRWSLVRDGLDDESIEEDDIEISILLEEE